MKKAATSTLVAVVLAVGGAVGIAGPADAKDITWGVVSSR